MRFQRWCERCECVWWPNFERELTLMQPCVFLLAWGVLRELHPGHGGPAACTHMTVLMPLSCWKSCNPQPTTSARRMLPDFSIRNNVGPLSETRKNADSHFSPPTGNHWQKMLWGREGVGNALHMNTQLMCMCKDTKLICTKNWLPICKENTLEKEFTLKICSCPVSTVKLAFFPTAHVFGFIYIYI